MLLALSQRHNGFRPSAPILVAAETNVAVDNTLAKLLATIKANPELSPDPLGPGQLLRVGDPGAIPAALAEYTVEAAVPGAKNRAGFWDSKKLKAAVGRTRVVFATCASAGASILDGVDFPLVIIDEATQVRWRLDRFLSSPDTPFQLLRPNDFLEDRLQVKRPS